ncbi:MAG: molecular chaperone HscC [Pseudomonadota bacterium]|nr:molecular chaperone HscC [Pseudomonadota bacterium]
MTTATAPAAQDNIFPSSPIIAIDLGTTNSLVGVFQQGQPVLIPNSANRLLTPSAIGLDQHQHVLIGQAAVERRHQGAPVLTSFKRFMGTDRQLSLGKKSFRAPELSALVLGALKADAEHFLGQPIQDAVITVPAYFNDIQRQATLAAAQMAGLNVSRLINEPTAAALAYGLGQTDDSCFLIFDLGGGTFDVSIVELFDGVIEVRASTGDNALGGDDFVSVLVEQFWQRHAATLGQPLDAPPPDLMATLHARAQDALHQLSAQAETTLSIQYQQHEASLLVQQEKLNQWIEPLLQRLRRPLERALRDARLKPDAIDQVVMVGGATRIPAVRRMVAKLFGRFPLTSIQPDEAIVRGACIQAGLRAKDQALKEIVLTDVCPFSLGIGTMGDQSNDLLFSPILERNTVIPASRVNSYHAATEGQRQILVKVFQGENRLCRDNIFLGEINVELPPNKEHLSIDVRFSYNPNGILDVDVHVPKTGQNLQKVLVHNQSVLNPEQIEQARRELAMLKIHPRDSLPNKTLMLKAERLYSEMTGTLREAIGQQTQQFEQVVNSQDPRKIAEAREIFDRFLQQVTEASLFED